jgi:hypothetical protein
MLQLEKLLFSENQGWEREEATDSHLFRIWEPRALQKTSAANP